MKDTRKTKGKGFLARLVEKLDKKMQERAQSKPCCSVKNNPKGKIINNPPAVNAWIKVASSTRYPYSVKGIHSFPKVFIKWPKAFQRKKLEKYGLSSVAGFTLKG